MSEPRAVAGSVAAVVAGVGHWTVQDERIRFRSDAYVVAAPEGAVMVDPLPLAEDALAAIGPVAAICLTNGHHQRSAWRYRRLLGAPVLAPAGAGGLVERPDRDYAPGERLPGGLLAIAAPGPINPGCVLLQERPDGAGVLFSADLLLRPTEDGLVVAPDEHLEDPAQARATIRSWLDLAVETLCPAHGAPVRAGAHAAIREALGG